MKNKIINSTINILIVIAFSLSIIALGMILGSFAELKTFLTTHNLI